MAVADHPLGPYTKQENNPILNYIEKDGEVLVSGPGHNSFFTVGNELFTSYINGPTLAPQLRPLADLGLVNHMHSAASTTENAALLTDGDTCQSSASAAYVFAGSEAVFTWDTPVNADMLLIYPAQDAALCGQAVINGSLTADFAQDAGGKPGAAICLAFGQTNVSSLEIRLSGDGRMGEIMLLGSAQ